MMSIEPRNEQQMLRQFWKKYPTYNLNALMRKRYEELMDARAFNEWLQNRQLKRQGEEYADAMGQDGGDGQPQNSPAPVGRRGAAASAPSRAAAGRAPVGKTWKNREPSASECVLASRRCWNTSKKASLLSASLCPTATPASTDPATSTWTNSRNPTEPLAENSKAAHSAGSGHRERLRIRRRWLSRQTFPSTAAPQFSAAWARHRHGGRSLPERWLRSVEASRSRPAQQQARW